MLRRTMFVSRAPAPTGARFFGTARPAYSTCILSLAGADRPGLLHQLLSRVVTPVGASVGKARMAQLHSEFGVVTEVHLKGEAVEKLKSLLSAEFPEADGYLTDLRLSGDGDGVEDSALKVCPTPAPDSVQLDIVGPSGHVLQRVAQFASDKSLDIVRVNCDVEAGSVVGYDVFKGTITLAGDMQLCEAIRDDVAQVAQELGVDIELRG